MVVPGAPVHDPTSAHVAASIEAVGASVDHHRGIRRVGAVSVAVPPADRVQHPGARGSRLGLGIRSGLRLRLRIRRGLRIGLRLRLRIRSGLRIGLRLGIRRRLRVRLRLRLGLRLGIRSRLRIRLRLRRRVNPRGGRSRIVLHRLDDGDRRRTCLGSVGQGGGQVHLIPIDDVTAGDRRALAVLGHLQDDHTVILEAPGQGGILELLGQQRLEGDSLALLEVHAKEIDRNLILAQLTGADLDGSHHRVEGRGIHVVSDGSDVRAALLQGSHAARAIIDIQDVDIVTSPVDFRHIGVVRLVRDADVRLLTDSHVQLTGLDTEVEGGHGNGCDRDIGALGRQTVTAPGDERDGRGESIGMASLGPGGLNVRELDGEEVVMKAVGGDIAREVDDTMVEDHVGRGVTQVNAGQPGIVGDGEGDLTADALAGGSEVGDHRPIRVGCGGCCQGRSAEGDARRCHCAGRQGCDQRPVKCV